MAAVLRQPDGRVRDHHAMERETRRHQFLVHYYYRLSMWRAVWLIVVIVTVIVLLSAVLQVLVEPETFPDLGTALWWAVVTVSTTGYGDVVPQSGPGRVVGGVVMVLSLALVPVITSLVVTALITRSAERRSAEQPPGVTAD
jgi:voltage-gated potassium channel